jgi:Tfp pilus assembly protein PilO
VNVLKLNLSTIFVVVALTAAFTFGLVIPGLKELHWREARFVDQLAKVQVDQRKVGEVSELYLAIMKNTEQMQDSRSRLPADRALGEFLYDLAENLKKHAIDDYVVLPRPARQVDPAKLPRLLKSAEGTTVLPVSVSFGSSFVQLFDFLDSMESLPRLSHVESLKLVNNERRPGNVRVEMLLHTYHRPDESRHAQPADLGVPNAG